MINDIKTRLMTGQMHIDFEDDFFGKVGASTHGSAIKSYTSAGGGPSVGETHERIPSRYVHTMVFITWRLVRPGLSKFWDRGGPGCPLNQSKGVVALESLMWIR